MLLITKENKLITNKLEMNRNFLEHLYNDISDKRIIKDIKFINEKAPKKYATAFTSGEYVLYIDFLYNYSKRILENILNNDKESINLLKLINDSKNVLKKIKNIQEKMDPSISTIFIKNTYKDFYYFSTKILNALEFKETNEIDIAKTDDNSGSFESRKIANEINIGKDNYEVLRVAKKTNDFSKKLQP